MDHRLWSNSARLFHSLPIIHKTTIMTTEVTILEGYTDMEKGAYLGAIASIATADRQAGEEELAYIDALIESAEISEAQTSLIRNAATSKVSDDDLMRFLDVLKTSDLRFSLVSDVIAFSQSL